MAATLRAAEMTASRSQEHNPGIRVRKIPPKVAQSFAAFCHDLPELLESHYMKWVAYHGNDRVGIAETQTELVHKCLQIGHKRTEFIVCSIEPQAGVEVESIEVSTRI